MRKVPIPAFCLFLFLGLGPRLDAENQGWIIKTMTQVAGNPMLVHFVWETARPPYGTMDRITLHRLVHKNQVFPLEPREKVILMIPGSWNAGGWSEITDPDINPVLYLANNNYDVYSMDFRTANIPDMDWHQFAEYGIDIGVTTDWDYGLFREDVKACVDLIKQLSRAEKIFMSGFSKGATHMFIYASKYEQDLKGLISLDGGIKDFPPTGVPLDEASFSQLVELFKAGFLIDPTTQQFQPWVSGVSGLDDKTYASWKLAGSLPYATVLAGALLPSEFQVISDFVADSAHHLWDYFGLGEGLLTNYDGGFIDRDVLVKILNEFHRYYPYIHYLEDAQLMAHDNVPYFDYDDNDIHLPAVAFLTRIMCPYDSCQLDFIPNMTKSKDVTINFLQEYGHMDVLFGKNSLVHVKQPLLEWLNSHLERAETLADNTLTAEAALAFLKAFFQIHRIDAPWPDSGNYEDISNGTRLNMRKKM